MSQQINLYEDRLRPNREWLTGRRLALAAALVLAGLAGWGIVERSAAERSVAELAGLQGEVAASRLKLAALARTHAERQVPDALKAELDGGRERLAEHKAVLTLLESGKLGNETGFSALMRGFSRLASNDLWLTGFTVAAGGHEIEIRGRLFDSGRLPDYVQRLANDAAFAGMRFAALDMQRGDAADKSARGARASEATAAEVAEVAVPRTLDFVLRSENVGEADGPARK